jgi:hypothetical protein
MMHRHAKDRADTPLDRRDAGKMRKIFAICLLALAGCQNVAGPFQARPPVRVDDPRISTYDQDMRVRDRLALPDNTGGAPNAGLQIPGSSSPIRY